MRIPRTNIFSLLLVAASTFAQSPRFALPDSAAITHYTPANHERMLFLFRTMPLGSWNYVWEDSTARHYGPTAQEFCAAFGTDSLDMTGNGTTFAPADVDGIAMIAIQALEDRTQFLRAALTDKDEEIKDVKSELAEMKMVVWRMRKATQELYFKNVQLQNRLGQLEKTVGQPSDPNMSSLR